MTSSHHGPYVQGYTRATMDETERGKAARWSKSQKIVRSSDWSLKPDSMKVESLVIAHQHGAVSTFPGLYTPPVTPSEWEAPEAVSLTSNGGRRRRYVS